MGLNQLKKSWKVEVINIILALGVSLLAYFIFIYFKSSIQEMLVPIIFLLALILLQFSNKK